MRWRRWIGCRALAHGELLWSLNVRRSSYVLVVNNCFKGLLAGFWPNLAGMFLIWNIVQMVPVRCISRSHRLKIDFLHETFKMFVTETTKPRVYRYLVSSSWPLPSLINLCPWDQKWAHPGGHMFYIGLIGKKHEKILLPETTSPRALIFGMWHHLVDHYQACSNYTPGQKIGTARG